MNDPLNFILNYGLAHGVNAELTTLLSPETPSMAIPARNQIFINLNWKNKKELPFQAAHEISHILNGDANNGTYYYTTATGHSKVEYLANKTAIDILLDYCDYEDLQYTNYWQFIEDFAIPSNLEVLVQEKLTRWAQ